MRVGVERGRNGKKRQAGAVAAIFFIWLVVVVSRMRLSCAGVKEITGRAVKFAAVHRKTHIFETDNLFNPPAGLKVRNGADVVYQDDKRVIHTGPNPLHN